VPQLPPLPRAGGANGTRRTRVTGLVGAALARILRLMERSGPHIDIDFPLVFHSVVITGSTATVVWLTSDSELRDALSNWPPVVVWLSLAATIVQFLRERAWWRHAALAFVVSAAMLGLCLR